jgi:recombinational DNA repair ATPase RecF
LTLNPNKARDKVFKQSDLSKSNVYPRFINEVEYDKFRHINHLTLQFTSPVSVISGSNKTGKTTILLSIACSHFEFKKRNYTNGNLERQR